MKCVVNTAKLGTKLNPKKYYAAYVFTNIRVITIMFVKVHASEGLRLRMAGAVQELACPCSGVGAWKDAVL